MGGDDDSFDCTYASIYPRQYVAYRLKPGDLDPSALDGDLTKAAWAEVPWTENFGDIATATAPQFSTRAKLRWDDEFLYVGAQMEEPQAWATLTEHNDVVYNDNDFEIFVDPGATTHYYKEFEMNAFNTTWSLCLDKPYGDGGHENSSRVQANGFDYEPPLRCSVGVAGGELNNPATGTVSWSVEVALPLEKVLVNQSGVGLPRDGDLWRINFSRVEWNVTVNESTGQYEKTPSCQSCAEPGADAEDNWVWSPMYKGASSFGRNSSVAWLFVFSV
jgi:hypothetical protein